MTGDIDSGIGEFRAAHGAPLYELQKRLGILHENALRAGSRAAITVAVVWGVPFVLSLFAGRAFGPWAEGSYLTDLSAWAKYVIAVSVFILAEPQIEKKLDYVLTHMARAPLLAPESVDDAARAVNVALIRRDSGAAEIVCLVLALLITGIRYVIASPGASNWAFTVTDSGTGITLAGWWSLLVSQTIFLFLLLRGLWRHIVWSFLMRALAGLKLRLVVTHPDGRGGLTFVGRYPNAYAMFIFGVSCVIGAALARQFAIGRIEATAYSTVLSLWLAFVLVMFAFPLSAFSRPLAKLKQDALDAYSAQGTRFQRNAERNVIGFNVVADSADEAAGEVSGSDPGKSYDQAKKLSTLVFDRSALLPVCAAALLPLGAAALVTLPYKEILSLLKKLLLL